MVSRLLTVAVAVLSGSATGTVLLAVAVADGARTESQTSVRGAEQTNG